MTLCLLLFLECPKPRALDTGPDVPSIMFSRNQGPQGLGIMIIEGKHAEVGQGIFISDIQEGSAAEQAGLIVGDMILQVNKDVILGSNYDSTASLLKKTEGVVTIIVCNPNKAKEEEKAKEGGKKEEEKPKQLTKPMSGTTPTKTSPLSSFNLASIIKSSHSTQRASSCVSHGSQIIPDHPHSSKKHSQSAPTKNNVSRAMTNKSSAASSKNPPRPTLLTTPNSTHPTKRQPSPPAITHGPSKSPGTTPEPTEAPPEPPADPATCEIKPGRETTVEINKDNVGLGLSIVGGSDTLLVSERGKILTGIFSGIILQTCYTYFCFHSSSLINLFLLFSKVKMTVYRDEAAASGGKEEDLLDIMEVELAKKAGKGLGLSIVGRKNGVGVFISDVVKGGAAEADGRLMKGDQIIAVNGQDLKGATQEEAAAVLKTATGRVTIKLGRLRPRKGAAPEKTSSSLLRDSASPETSPILPASPPTIITPSPSAAMGPPLRTRTIRLERGPDGLGFSIVGGHGSPHGDLPIYVKTVFDRGSASKGGLGEDNRLHRGDQILAVDGVSLDGRTHQEAVALLKGTRKRGSVTLTIAR
ncbi:hypothetical protein J437_LFUL011746 [Ladona fulva]|uniref:PDZ domain-containing protein n=1 Tax=Ladona fulva TaxID=123851 RepID=A0A8K0KFV5_LADFU|nr:hypothetical protein J437_LFUL011746 [Ladona fulva]